METCALQVRMALEHLVLSTLVANRSGIAAITQAFNQKSAADARAIIKRINPQHWPVSFKFKPPEDSTKGGTWHPEAPAKPFLLESEWGTPYGYCSSLLHAP